jgi:hypothetical protein
MENMTIFGTARELIPARIATTPVLVRGRGVDAPTVTDVAFPAVLIEV